MTLKPRGFLSGILEILETAILTIVAVLMLIVVFILMVLGLLYLMTRYPQIPASWFWPIIWTGMGLVMIGMIVLCWWWGRALKARDMLEKL